MDSIAAPIWCLFGLIAWIWISRRMFGGPWFGVVLVGLLMQSSVSGGDRYVDVQVMTSGTWVNPGLAASYIEDLYFVGAVNHNITHTAVAAHIRFPGSLRFAITEFETPEGELYWLGFIDVFRSGDRSSYTQRLGVKILTSEIGPLRVFINTNFGDWKELYQGSQTTLVPTEIAYIFDSPNSEHWPDEFAVNDGPFNPSGAVGLKIIGQDTYRGASSQPATQPATAPSTEEFDAINYAVVPTTMPSSTQPTTQQWVAQTHGLIFGENGPKTVVGYGKTRAQAFIDTNTGTTKPHFFVAPEPSIAGSWGLAAEQFMQLLDAIKPDWRGSGNPTVDPLGGTVLDGDVSTFIKWMFEAWDKAQAGFLAPMLVWFRIPIEFGMALGVSVYGYKRVAWALGLRNPEQFIPPILDQDYMHVKQFDAFGNLLYEMDVPADGSGSSDMSDEGTMEENRKLRGAYREVSGKFT